MERDTMNYTDRFLRETASYSVLDLMLADIAVRIQLTPTDYQKALDHYEAINEWLDRENSPLHGRVQLLYPQGGFMIGATTARHATDADFDIGPAFAPFRAAVKMLCVSTGAAFAGAASFFTGAAFAAGAAWAAGALAAGFGAFGAGGAAAACFSPRASASTYPCD